MLTTEEIIPNTLHTEKIDNLDLLNRQEFIDQMFKIAESLSTNKENACYAINGEWGVGKTYVLDEFEKRVRSSGQAGTTLSKYLLFHYNCWQYDYYEEPLIAIVAAILDQIDEQVLLLSNDRKEQFVAVLKAIGISLWGKACVVVEEQTGISLKEIGEVVNESGKSAVEKVAQNHDYDSYFDFKKILQKLSSTTKQLAQDQTVMVVVDELDRCLPEYTIKVLERLHHIFDDIPNVQVLLAVDRRQIENTVKSIYGENISVRQYLAKFIDFELKLVAGEVSSEIGVVYKAYFDRFTYDVSQKEDVDSVCTTILKGIDIRTCKAILEKSYLCHRLLNPVGGEYDASILCIEIFLTLLKEYGLNVSYAKNNFDISNLFTNPHRSRIENGERDRLFFSTSKVLTGLAVLSDIYKGEENFGYMKYDDRGRAFIDDRNLWGLLLGVYRTILGFKGDYWSGFRYKRVYVGDIILQDYVLEYWKFIKTLN